MSDKLGFLSGDTPSETEDTSVAEAEAPAPEQAAAETPPAEPTTPQERPRGPDGKFASTADTPTPEIEPPLTKSELAGTMSALLTERDRRQAAERHIADLEARAASETEPPSFEARMQAEIQSLKMQNLRMAAEQGHGKDTVAEAYKWAFDKCEPTSPEFDPNFNAKMAHQLTVSGDPYETAVQAFKADRELAEFQAWKAANAAVPAATPPAAATPPPRSLATASGTGAVGKDHVPVGDGNAYAALFPT